MRPHSLLFLSSALLIGGCSMQEVDVQISPAMYRIGTIRSSLATPVVDEAVKIKPSKVTIYACSTTPPSKVIQFQREFSSRSKAELVLIRLNDDSLGDFCSS
jgi:ribosomal protein L24